MAVPSRAFVGILVFALLASVAVVPYTVLILAGYQAPAEAPHELLFPEPQDAEPGTKVVLVLASLFCVVLVGAAWRGLVAAARQDAQVRRQRADAGKPNGPAASNAADEQPPGYQ